MQAMDGRGDDRLQPVSVVVCAYTTERLELLQGALRSVLAQGPAQLIVVIDHNPDLHAVMAAWLAAEPVSGTAVDLVANDGPRGLSGGRNTGTARATEAVVAFLDDDATAHPGWLAALIAPFADPTVAGTGGVARPVWARGGRPRWFPPEFDWVVGCTYRGGPEGPGPIRNPLGCNMAFRRDLLDEVGGFTPGLGRIGKHPLGCEETELCIRILQARPDRQIRFVPEAVIGHHVSDDRHQFGYFRRRCFAEGLSKAMVSDHVGADDALSTERGYVRRALPAGVARGLVDAVARRDPAGVARAGSIGVGLAWTAAGFGRGLLARRAGRDSR